MGSGQHCSQLAARVGGKHPLTPGVLPPGTGRSIAASRSRQKKNKKLGSVWDNNSLQKAPRTRFCSCSYSAHPKKLEFWVLQQQLAVVSVPVSTQTNDSPLLAACSGTNPLSRQLCQKLIAGVLIRVTNFTASVTANDCSWENSREQRRNLQGKARQLSDRETGQEMKENLHNHLLHAKRVPRLYFQLPYIRESDLRTFSGTFALYAWKRRHLTAEPPAYQASLPTACVPLQTPARSCKLQWKKLNFVTLLSIKRVMLHLLHPTER